MNFFPLGTLTNVAAVLVGGTVGMLVRNRMPDQARELVFKGLGLCTWVIGMDMALKLENPLTLIFSVVLGGMLGEFFRLEDLFEKGALKVKERVKSDNTHFTDGMITAFLIFCVGPMTIMGGFDEGLRSDPTLLFTKSMLDGFASIALAATYGAGVLFSVIPLFLYQFGLTACAALLQDVLSEAVITQLTAVGGILILGIGVNLLDLTRIRISNLLPALPLIVILTLIFSS